MTAGFKNDTNNASNMTDLTAPKVNLKSPFPVTPQKEFVRKNSTIMITPEKPSKCVEKGKCVPSEKLSEIPKDNRTKTSNKSNLSIPTC